MSRDDYDDLRDDCRSWAEFNAESNDDATVLIECEYCNGSGEIVSGQVPVERSERCSACRGVGELTPERAAEVEQEEWEQRERLTNP